VEEASVRGTYVRGLRRVDVLALDAFEGEVCVFVFGKGRVVPRFEVGMRLMRF